MGFFHKKPDPLVQRSQSLNRRIAELEAEIARLNQKMPARLPAKPGAPTDPAAASAGPSTSSPRPPQSTPPSNEPVFVPMPVRREDPRGVELPGREAVELGLKRRLWSQWWRRLKRQFVDPPPTNEKLVNYLAAGSIQGLRPLRYERRIARNRILLVCAVLALLLWGLLAVLWHAH